MTLASHMETVARAIFGEPNPVYSTAKELRFGNKGSMSVDLEKGTWFDHETQEGGGVLKMIKRELGHTGRDAFVWMAEQGCDVDGGGLPPGKSDGAATGANSKQQHKRRVVAVYPYRDETGAILFEVMRHNFVDADGSLVIKDGKPTKVFTQRRPDPDKPGRHIFNVKCVRVIPYRLDELLAALCFTPGGPVLIVEGEAKVDALAKWDFTATCNSGGAKKWWAQHAAFLRGVDVIIVPDNDSAGREHARTVAESLHGIASRVRVVWLPGLAEKGDILDCQADGHTRKDFIALVKATEDCKPQSADEQPTADDGRAVIRVTAGNLHKDAADAEAALTAAGVPLYVRSSTIVRPIVEEVPSFHGAKTRSARTQAADDPRSTQDPRREHSPRTVRQARRRLAHHRPAGEVEPRPSSPATASGDLHNCAALSPAPRCATTAPSSPSRVTIPRPGCCWCASRCCRRCRSNQPAMTRSRR